jgi:hypothetical protein
MPIKVLCHAVCAVAVAMRPIPIWIQDSYPIELSAKEHQAGEPVLARSAMPRVARRVVAILNWPAPMARAAKRCLALCRVVAAHVAPDATTNRS